MGQGTIPSDWEGEYCRYAVCWPNSPQWLAVLRGVLALPASGRFWDGHTGTITEAQQVIVETYDTNLHLGEVIMACNDSFLGNIATALEHIAQGMAAQAQAITVTSGGCCDTPGSGGAGREDAPIGTTEQGNPDTDPPPDGFEDWPEFFANKCARANDFLTRFEQSLDNMKAAVFVGVEASGVAIALTLLVSIAIPYAAIYAIALLLLGVVAEQVLTYANEIMVDNHNALLCTLFQGNTPSQSKGDFLTAFNGFVDDAELETVTTFTVKQLVGIMTSNQAINEISQKSTTRTYTEADCSACGDAEYKQKTSEPQDYAQWPTVAYNYGQQIVIHSYTISPQEGFQWDYMTVDFGQLVDMEIVSIDGWVIPPDFQGASAFRAGSSFGANNAGETDVYNSDTPPSGTLTVGNITFAAEDGTDWTMTVIVTPAT